MKKLIFLLGTISLVGITAYGKEIYPESVNLQETMIEPVVVEEIVPWGYVELRGGWDFWSEYGKIYESLNKNTDESGYEFAIEMYKYWSNFDLGIGLSYQKHADRKSFSGFPGSPGTLSIGGEYKSIPVYLVGKYRLNCLDGILNPYLKAMVGYSFNFDNEDIKLKAGNLTENDWNERIDTNVDEGWYWSLGAGIEYKNFTVDIAYGINYTEMHWKQFSQNQVSFDNDYERVTLSVGYKFNIW